MNPDLNDSERALIKMLSTEPSWKSLLEKLEPGPVSGYRLDKAPTGQYEIYIYESGFADGANNILDVLKNG